MRASLYVALCALAAMVWAAPNTRAAHFLARPEADITQNNSVPTVAVFGFEAERGLLLRVWLNGRGPYVFAVDTGAGMNVIADRVVKQINLPTKTVQPTTVGGLTTARTTSRHEAVIRQMDVGNSGNALPKQQTALIVTNLPVDLDGILDPTEAYAPYGYSIDLPNRRIAPITTGFVQTQTRTSSERAIVPWVRSGSDDRPFVKLGDGRLALVDTGSRFGLAVNGSGALILGRNGRPAPPQASRDIAGGSILARRVEPTTITIGELELRRIPTDVLFGIDKGVPVILGRDALAPFKISFDRQRRLIEFVTSEDS